MGLPWQDKLVDRLEVEVPGVRRDAGEHTSVVCLIAGHAKHSSVSSMALREGDI